MDIVDELRDGGLTDPYRAVELLHEAADEIQNYRATVFVLTRTIEKLREELDR